MSIAEKLTTVAENQQKVYDAGYEQGKIDGNALLYVQRTNGLFQNVVFPDGYEIKIVSVNHQGNMENMFFGVKGIRKITLDVPDSVAYNLYGLVRESSVEEIVIPDGLHVTSWTYFAYSASSLRKVIGRIDLTGSTTNHASINLAQKLEEVYFMPGTIEASINVGGSPNLIDASTQSIIDGLADLTGATAQIVTFHKVVYDKLTEAQKATIATKNWEVKY